MRLLESLKRSWPIAASVLLLGLAFPPLNLALLVFVAAAPWLASLRDTDDRGALRSGFTFGLLYFLVQMFWLVPFVGRWTGSLALAAVPWVLTGLIAGLVYMPLGWLVHRCWARGRWWAVPFVWAGHEAFRAHLPGLAFPWANIADPLVAFPAYVQHASFGTVFFVSAWVVLANVVIATFVWPARVGDQVLVLKGPIVLRTAFLFCGIMLVSVVRYSQTPATETRVFTLGQLGVDMAFSDRATRPRSIFDAGNLIQSRAALQGTDLLVYPEGFAEGGATLPPVNPLGPEPRVPVLFPGFRKVGEKTFAAAFSYDGRWQSTDKTRLVVFGEYVPGRGVIPGLDAFDLPNSDLSPGSTVQVLTVNGMRVAPLVCFEGVFTELVEVQQRLGAQVLAQMSIDDWYEGTPAWQQLWHASVWRSIESGLPMVRVGSRGMSLATDARGNVRAFAPPGQMAAIRVEVGLPTQGDGFAYRTGFLWLCWAVMVAVGLEALLRRGPKS